MPNARHKEEAGVKRSTWAKPPTIPLNKAFDVSTMISKAQNQAEAKLNKKADQEFHQKDYLITTKEIPKLTMQRVIIESN